MRLTQPWEFENRGARSEGDGRTGDGAEARGGGRLWKLSDPRVEGAMHALSDRLGSTGALRTGGSRLDHLHGAVPFGGVRRIRKV